MITRAEITLPSKQILDVEIHSLRVFDQNGPIMEIGILQTSHLSSLLSSVNEAVNVAFEYKNIQHSLMVTKVDDKSSESLLIFKPVESFVKAE